MEVVLKYNLNLKNRNFISLWIEAVLKYFLHFKSSSLRFSGIIKYYEVLSYHNEKQLLCWSMPRPFYWITCFNLFQTITAEIIINTFILFYSGDNLGYTTIWEAYISFMHDRFTHVYCTWSIFLRLQ